MGIVRRLTVPSLPATVSNLTLVARLVEIQPVDEIAVTVGLSTPTRQNVARPGSGVTLQMAGDFVVAALRDVRLMETGTHRFQVTLGGQPVVSVVVPVVVLTDATTASVH